LINVPRGDAEWFWHKCEGCGWKNNGKAIVDWHATIRAWKLAGYLPSQRNGQVKGDGPMSGADKMIFQKEFERVDGAIKTIKAGLEGLANIRESDRERYKTLVARRAELRKLLGVTL
jgi:hypothetical protein